MGGTAGGRYRVCACVPPAQSELLRRTLGGWGWAAAAGGVVDLLWTCGRRSCEPRSANRHGPPKLHNHFGGLACLTDKAALRDTLLTARRRAARRKRPARPLAPEAYVLSRDAAELAAARQREPDAVWICKPPDRARGEGIFLTREPAASGLAPRTVVQRYVDDPHLLDGAKYTLRCYVLVTSFLPLQAWLFDDGFAKRCSRPFSLRAGALADPLAHLTNPEIQRRSTDVAASDRNLDHAGYRRRLRQNGEDDAALMARIGHLIAAAVVAAQDSVLVAAAYDAAPGVRRFELLGLDLAVDRRLRPWLLECNLNPSLEVEADPRSSTAGLESSLKAALVEETLARLGLGPRPPSGRFRPLVPAADTARSAALFDLLRPPDAAVHRRPPDVVRPAAGASRALSPPERLVWRALHRGEPVAAIASRLQAQAGERRTVGEHEVTSLLLRWFDEGLVEIRAGTTGAEAAPARSAALEAAKPAEHGR